VARDLKLVNWIPHSLRRLGRDIDNTDISIPLYLDFEMATIRHFPNNRKFIYPDAHLRDPPPLETNLTPHMALALPEKEARKSGYLPE